MLSTDLIKKIRHIEIRTKRLVNDSFAGEYHSVFKGRGMVFDEVRPYQYGDEIRTIDWNVTARTGEPYVKRYVEERELTVMLVVDASASEDFGTVRQFKRELAAELAAVLSFAATTNNDRVGLLIFTDAVELYIPPRKGRQHVLRLIRELLAFQPKRQRHRYQSRPGHRQPASQAAQHRLSGFGFHGRPRKLSHAAGHHESPPRRCRGRSARSA